MAGPWDWYFDAAHPDVQVSMQRMDAGLYYNKLPRPAGPGGGRKFLWAMPVLTRFERAAGLEDLEPDFYEHGWAKGDFDPSVLVVVTFWVTDGPCRGISIPSGQQDAT
jgi:hypothetical protein